MARINANIEYKVGELLVVRNPQAPATEWLVLDEDGKTVAKFSKGKFARAYAMAAQGEFFPQLPKDLGVAFKVVNLISHKTHNA